MICFKKTHMQFVISLFRLVLSFFLLFIISCNKEDDTERIPAECLEEIYLGSYYLSELSKKAIPYSLDAEKLIYIDSANNELNLSITKNSTRHIIYNTWIECDFDPAYNSTYQYRTDFQYVLLENEGKNILIDFQLAVNVELVMDSVGMAGDFMEIRISRLDNPNVGYRLIGFYTDKKEHEEEHLQDALFYYDFELGDRELTEVYVQNKSVSAADGGTLKFITAYNLEAGLLSFTDFEGTQWFFDRIE